MKDLGWFCCSLALSASTSAGVAWAADCYDAWAYGFILASDVETAPTDLEVKVPPADQEPPYLITSSDGQLRLILERAP